MNPVSGNPGIAQYRTLSKTPAPRGAPDTAAQARRRAVDSVDLSSPLTLEKIQELLRTGIGEKVAGLFGEAGVDPADVAGVDYSPEATAERIVGFSTGLYDIFKAQNTSLSEDEVIDKFESTLRKAVAQGAGEAFAIIGATLGEDALGVGHRTVDLVNARYDAFFARLRGEDAPE